MNRPAILLMTLWMSSCQTASAAPDSRPSSGNDLVLNAARTFVVQNTRQMEEQVSISVGPLAPGTRLPRCQQIDVFLPPNHRLWGKTTVGVKCAAPTSWTVYVAAHVKVSGNYLLTTRKLNRGQVITPSDVKLHEGDLTTEPDSILRELPLAVGFRLKHGLGAQQPLRREDLILPPVIRQGNKVKIIVRHENYSVGTEGVALNDAAEGATIKVRSAAGKTISGIARSNGEVEITP